MRTRESSVNFGPDVQQSGSPGVGTDGIEVHNGEGEAESKQTGTWDCDGCICRMDVHRRVFEVFMCLDGRRAVGAIAMMKSRLS